MVWALASQMDDDIGFYIKVCSMVGVPTNQLIQGEGGGVKDDFLATM